MHVLILRPYRKDNIYFRTIEEREKISKLIICIPFIQCNKLELFSSANPEPNAVNVF